MRTVLIVRGNAADPQTLRDLIVAAKAANKLEVNFDGQSYSIRQAENKLASMLVPA